MMKNSAVARYALVGVALIAGGCGGSRGSDIPEWIQSRGPVVRPAGLVGGSLNTAPLQAAIDEAAGLGQLATVWLDKPGAYLTGPLRVRSGVAIACSGSDVILRLAPGSDHDLFFAHYTTPVNQVRLSGCTLDGDKASNAKGTAVSFGGTDIEIDHLTVRNPAGSGIIVGVPTGGGRYRIHHNYVENPSVPGVGWPGIAVSGGDDVELALNVVVSSDGAMGYGVGLEPNSGWSVNRATIVGNRTTGGSIAASGSAEAPVSNVVIAANTINAQGSYAARFESGAAIYVRGITGGVVITANRAYGPETRSGALSVRDLDGFSATGNFLFGQDTSGDESLVWIANASNGTVADNLLQAYGGGMPRFGIIEAGVSDHNQYRNNQFSGVVDPYGIKAGLSFGPHSSVEWLAPPGP